MSEGSQPEPDDNHVAAPVVMEGGAAGLPAVVAVVEAQADGQWQLGFQSVAPKPVRKTEITDDRARMLATTRRHRFNEFWAGAWLVTIPGTWEAVEDLRKVPIVIPSGGHIIEALLFIVTGTLFFASLFNYSDPTSAELLKELFPETAKNSGIAKRIGKTLGEIFSAAKNAVP